MMYGVKLGLHVSGSGRADHFDRVVDAYADLEDADGALLDSSFGYSDQDDHAEMDVEITVAATSEDEAFRIAASSVRSAIHAAGGSTPDWTERHPADAVYRITDDSVDLLDV